MNETWNFKRKLHPETHFNGNFMINGRKKYLIIKLRCADENTANISLLKLYCAFIFQSNRIYFLLQQRSFDLKQQSAHNKVHMSQLGIESAFKRNSSKNYPLFE